MMHRLWDTIEEYPDQLRESWKPQTGDVVVGRFLAYERAESAYGPVVIALLGEADRDGKATGSQVAVWLKHKVLWEEFRRTRPKAGELLAIRRLEDNEVKGYCRYVLLVDRDDRIADGWQPDFSQDDPSTAAEHEGETRAFEPSQDVPGEDSAPDVLTTDNDLPF